MYDLKALSDQFPDQAEERRLRKELAELKRHLKEIEWVYSGPDDYDQCPACREYELHEHKPDCWLAAALKEEA